MQLQGLNNSQSRLLKCCKYSSFFPNMLSCINRYSFNLVSDDTFFFKVFLAYKIIIVHYNKIYCLVKSKSSRIAVFTVNR